MKELLYAAVEDFEDRTGERNFELDRAATHYRPEEDPDEVLDLLRQMGF